MCAGPEKALSTIIRIEAAFEKAGILFIANDETAGIRCSDSQEKATIIRTINDCRADCLDQF
jgi:hypothetical protein